MRGNDHQPLKFNKKSYTILDAWQTPDRESTKQKVPRLVDICSGRRRKRTINICGTGVRP